MATSLPKPTIVKRLNELLKEQQEPFSLDLYLLERGYSMRRVSSKGRSDNWNKNSSKELKGLGSHDLKIVKSISQFSKILKSVVEKLASSKNHKLSDSNGRAIQDRKLSASTNGGRIQHVAELDHLSTCSSISKNNIESKLNSSNQGTTSQLGELRNSRDKEAHTYRTHQWDSIEESKQSSPVSVLEELPSERVCPFSNPAWFSSKTASNQPRKVTEEMIFSASLRDLLVHSVSEKQGSRTSNAPSQNIKTKKILEQTKQLFFDCVREVLENHRKARSKQWVPELLGAEELGKIICEQILPLGKLSGNVANVNQLINFDFWEEMNDLQLQTRDIGMEIGDAIFKEIIDEIVTDMTDSF